MRDPQAEFCERRDHQREGRNDREDGGVPIKKETAEQLILAEMSATTQRDKDIIHLKQIILSIRPYSRWWRWGYIGSLRRAIKALEKLECQKKKEVNP